MTTAGDYIVAAERRSRRVPPDTTSQAQKRTRSDVQPFEDRLEEALREFRILRTLASPMFKDKTYLSVFFLVPLLVLVLCTVLWHADAGGIQHSSLSNVISVSVGLSVIAVGLWAGVRTGSSDEEVKVRELARVHGGLAARYQMAQVWAGVVLSSFLGLLVILVVKAPQMGATVALHAPILVVPLALAYLVNFSFASVVTALVGRRAATLIVSILLSCGMVLAASGWPRGALTPIAFFNVVQITCISVLQSLYTSLNSTYLGFGILVFLLMIAALQFIRFRLLNRSQKTGLQQLR